MRWTDDRDLSDLTAYLRWLARQLPVLVVDGSPPTLFARHAHCWKDLVRHIAPDPDLVFANGKVNGVLTGVRRSQAAALVIADDDIRYDESSLCAVVRLLDDADLVRPQNYFTAMPWHARWDTARSLMNRCFGTDYPGTLGVRREALVAHGYDGNALFENLELIRTVLARGGREVRALDLFVGRRPPTWGRFLNQRLRQAYDEFAQPGRMVLALSILPALLIALARERWCAVVLGALSTVVIAEAGRRRAGGRRVYPPSAAWFAPLWVIERGLCSWAALAARLRGGAHYNGRRLPLAAHSLRELRG